MMLSALEERNSIIIERTTASSVLKENKTQRPFNRRLEKSLTSQIKELKEVDTDSVIDNTTPINNDVMIDLEDFIEVKNEINSAISEEDSIVNQG